MPINGKKKGDRAELDVCRLLAGWWEGCDVSKVRAEDLGFRRSPNSGSWDRKKAAGDIIVPDDCNLCIEVKNREEWSWDTYLRGVSRKSGKESLDAYWKQTTDAIINNSIPLLIFTKNLHPWYIRLLRGDATRLGISICSFGWLSAHEDVTVFGYLDDFISVVIPSYVSKSHGIRATLTRK